MSGKEYNELKPFAYVHYVAHHGTYNPRMSFDKDITPENTAFTENLYSEEVVHDMYEALKEVCDNCESPYTPGCCVNCTTGKALAKAGEL